MKFIGAHIFDYDATFRGDVTIEGNLTISNSVSQTISFGDNDKLKFGDGNDLEIYHNGTNSFIQNLTGDLYHRTWAGSMIFEQNQNDGDIIFKSDDGSGGTTTYFYLDGSSKEIRVNEEMQFEDDVKLNIGTGEDLTFKHDGTNSNITNSTGNLIITNQTNDGDIILQADDGSGGLAEYIRLDGGTTNIKVFKDVVFADNIDAHFGTGGDLRIYHDGTDSRFQEFTGNLNIINYADDKDITLQSDDGSGGITPYLTLDGSAINTKVYKDMRFNDNVDAQFGSNGDLQILHDGTNSYMSNTTGNLFISNSADDSDIIFRSDDGSGGVETYFFLDGGQNSSSPYTVWPDHSHIALGTSFDLDLYHTSTQSFIENWTGNFTIRNNANDADLILECDNGSGGVTAYITLDGNTTTTKFSKNTLHEDNVEARFGTDSDFQMYHSGSHGFITNSTGNLTIKNAADDKDILFQCDDGSGGVETYFFLDGSATQTKFNKDTRHIDNIKVLVGSDGDAAWWHDGTRSRLDNYTGNLEITNYADDSDIVFKSDDGSGGVETYFFLDGNAGGANPTTIFPDNARLAIGSGQDLKIYHSPSISYIEANNELRIRQTKDNADILLQSDDGSGGIATYMTIDGGDTDIKVHKNFEIEKTLTMQHTADPSDPATGHSVMWSDTSGNLKVKINVGGSVVTRTLATGTD